MLNLWKKNNKKVTIISEDFHNKKRPSIQFLADARNYYLHEIKKDFDMVLAIDMDLNKGIDPRGIAHSFSRIKDWDVVCSNGIKKFKSMWDTFAFEANPEHTRSIYTPGSEIVPVKSCFGGITIYKKSVLSNCYYDSVNNTRCEHVGLSQCMRDQHKAKIVMNPTQIVRYRASATIPFPMAALSSSHAFSKS